MASNLDIYIKATNQASSALKEVQGELNALDKATGTLGKGFTGLQNGMKMLGGAALVGVGAATAAVSGLAIAGVQASTSFTQGLNEAFTLMPGISEQAMGAMSQDVKDFAVEFGTLPNEVIPALYQSLSAGVPPGNVFDFLETAQMAAKGGLADLTVAVDGISSVVNAYGADVLSATQASDQMFTAIRLGKTDFNQLSSSLFNVVPVAAALGIEFGDVTAALAAMTAQGVPTSVATTQLRQAFVELSKDGSATSDLFKEIAGESFRDFINSGKNVQEAFQLLENYANSTNVGVNDLFGSVEAGNAILALTGKGTEAFSNALAEMDNSFGATQAAFDQMMTGLQPIFDRLAAMWQVALIDIGTAIGPALTPVLNWLEGILPRAIEGLVGFFEWAGRAAGTFFQALADGESPMTAFRQALGAILTFEQAMWLSNLEADIRAVITAIGDATQPIRDFVTEFVSWKDVLIALAIVAAPMVIAAIKGIAVVLAAPLLVLGLLTLAVATLRNAWETNFLGIQTVATNVFGELQGLWDGLIAGFTSGNWQPFFASLENVWTHIKAWLTFVYLTIGFRVKDWVKALSEWADDVWPRLSTSLGLMMVSFAAWLGLQATTIAAETTKWAGKLSEWAAEVWPVLKPELVAMLKNLTDWIGLQALSIQTKLLTWKSKFTEWAGEIWTALKPDLDTMLTSLKTWIEEQVPILATLVQGWQDAFADFDPAAAFEGIETTLGNIVTAIENTTAPIRNFVEEFVKVQDVLLAIGIMATVSAIPALAGVGLAAVTAGVTAAAAFAPVLVTFAGLVVALAALRVAWETNFLDIQGLVGDLATEMGTLYSAVTDAFETGDWAPVVTSLANLWTIIDTWGRQQFPEPQFMIDMRENTQALVAKVQSDWAGLVASVSALWGLLGLVAGITWRFIKENILAPIDEAITGLDGKWESLSSQAITWWTTISTNALTAWGWVKDNIITPITEAASTLATKWAEISSAATSAWETLKSNIATILEAIRFNIAFYMELAKLVASRIMEEMRTRVEGIWNTLKNAAVTIFGAIKAAIDALVEAKDNVVTAFEDFMAFVNGMSFTYNPFATLQRWIDGVKGAATAAATAIAGIGGGGGYGSGVGVSGPGITGGGGSGVTTFNEAAGTTFFPGGRARINERGTEMIMLPGQNREVFLPRGAKILSHEDSMMLAGAGGGVTMYNTFNVSSDLDLEAAANRIAYKTAQIIKRNNL